MKKKLLLLALLISSSIQAQDDWLLLKTQWESESERLVELIPVTNDKTDSFAIFLRGKREFRAQLYNKEKQLVSEVTIKDLPKNFDVFVNSINSEKNYTLFFKNISGKKYGNLSIDFSNKSYHIHQTLPIDLKRKKLIETFNKQDKLYVLTIKDHSSLCEIYVFNIDGSYSKKEIDLSSISFEKIRGHQLKLSDLLTSRYAIDLLSKIDYNEPNSLETTAKYNKVFFDNNIITILNNYYDDFTYIIEISVIDFTYDYKKVENISFDNKGLKIGVNSIIYENYLFSLNATPHQLNLSIYNLETGTIEKEYRVSKDEEITFKNTPIILEGGDFKNYRKLDKTSQFLRKISNPYIAITVYRSDGNFVVTLGSSKQVANAGSGAIVGGMLGGAIGGAIAGALSATFNSYTKTKSTRIVCLFDQNFDHIDGAIPLNGFDKINNYIKEKDLKRRPLQTVFKYKGGYIWGSYNKSSKFYRFLKF